MSPLKRLVLIFLGVLFAMFLPKNLGLILHTKAESIGSGLVKEIEYISGSPRLPSTIAVRIKDFEGKKFNSYLSDSEFSVKVGDTLSYRIFFNGGEVRILQVNGLKVQEYYEWWDFIGISIYVVMILGSLSIGLYKGMEWLERKRINRVFKEF